MRGASVSRNWTFKCTGERYKPEFKKGECTFDPTESGEVVSDPDMCGENRLLWFSHLETEEWILEYLKCRATKIGRRWSLVPLSPVARPSLTNFAGNSHG